MERFDCLGTKVSATNLDDSFNFLINNIEKAKNNYICCANAHTVVFAYENEYYQKILNNAYMVLPDGGPVAKKGGKKVQKVSGVDFFEKILTNAKNIKCFYYGNTKDNLNKLIDKISVNYKNIEVCGFEESKFRDLTETEKIELKNRIKKEQTDIVWVGLGAPKQEIFCAEMCKNTSACWIAVGGAFNVVANVIPRAPKWMQNHSLEWLYRFLKEPKRLFKRYFVGNFKFVWYSIIHIWKRKN